MKSPKVSVMVPVYNVAEYLPRCLDSLAAQSLESLEVILVNDGSTDGSGDILRRYAASVSPDASPPRIAHHRETACSYDAS